MIQNVRKNFDNFTGKNTEKENLPCKTQSMLATPPDERYKEIFSGSSLNNFPVEVTYVSNSYPICVANSKRLRGENTRKKPKRVKEEYMKIPKYSYQLYKFLTRTVDVMFVNGIPSLVTFSRNIRLITCKYLPTRTEGQLDKSLIETLKLYARGVFVTCLVLMDMELEKVKEKLELWKLIPQKHENMSQRFKDKFV